MVKKYFKYFILKIIEITVAQRIKGKLDFLVLNHVKKE